MAAGYGTGEVTVTPEGKAVMKADLDLAMAAAGLRGEIARPPAHGNGFALAVTSDARFTRTSSDEGTRRTGGGADANEAVVWLARASIEGSRRFAIGEDGNAATLTPSLEFGLRIDGGDAEEGFGAELKRRSRLSRTRTVDSSWTSRCTFSCFTKQRDFRSGERRPRSDLTRRRGASADYRSHSG